LYLLPEDIGSYASWMRRAATASSRPTVAQELEERRAIEKEFPTTPKGFIANLAVPSLLRVYVTTIASDARDRLARVALAAAAFQLSKQRSPAQIEELVPAFLDAVPLDPYDGKPVRMLAGEGRLTFYSIGGDLKDDHGTEKRRGNGDTEGDITYCLGSGCAGRFEVR